MARGGSSIGVQDCHPHSPAESWLASMEDHSRIVLHFPLLPYGNGTRKKQGGGTPLCTVSIPIPSPGQHVYAYKERH